MTSLETYVSRRLANLSSDTVTEKRYFEENGHLREHDVTDIRSRAHELKMLCEHGIGDEDLINLSKAVYNEIVRLDELTDYS